MTVAATNTPPTTGGQVLREVPPWGMPPWGAVSRGSSGVSANLQSSKLERSGLGDCEGGSVLKELSGLGKEGPLSAVSCRELPVTPTVSQLIR